MESWEYMLETPCAGASINDFILMSQSCLYRAIIDAAHVGILICQLDGTIRLMNSTFEDMFDIVHKESTDKNICDYFPNSRLITIMKTGKEDKDVKFTFKGQDALVSRHPIIDNGKVVGGFVEVYFRDISKLPKLLKQLNNLEAKVKYYKRRVQGLPRAKYSLDDIVGQSKIIEDIKKKVISFAKSSEPILVQGESGVGKELFAHSIHNASPRSAEPFISINCAAIPHDLLESELFGYEEGTFTGAKRGGKVGMFELADRGSIFLDEIGELPFPMQAKLLRVIENKEIQKIGRSSPTYSDFRIIAATNKELFELANRGEFRPDLFHRLNTLGLRVPALRERVTDIPILIRFLLDNAIDKPSVKDLTISSEVMKLANAYAWPGNVREMKNVFSFALLLMEEGDSVIKLRHLPPYLIEESVVNNTAINSGTVSSIRQARDKAEREVIQAALQKTDNNKTQAAKILKISRNELYKKIRKHRLS